MPGEFDASLGRAVLFAHEDAQALGSREVGSEHLLLRLVRVEDCTAVHVLARLEILALDIRTRILRIVGQSDPTYGALSYTDGANAVLERARREALDLGHDYVGTEHLLLAFSWETNGIAAQVMMHFDLHPERVRRQIIQIGEGE